jgi:putative endonuclease
VIVWLLTRLDALRHAVQRGRLSPTLALGRRGEDVAQRYLQREGFRILARNWTGPHLAESDIVASDNGQTVFVEVKSRAVDEFGAPGRAIDDMKIAAQRRAAYAWARMAGTEPDSIRFDLVTVVFSDPPRVEHFRNAWGFRGRGPERRRGASSIF